MKQLVINKEDLSYNINEIKNYIKDISKNEPYTIIAVVKGNGYGLGIIDYSKFLKEDGIDYFAVATLEEALELRKANVVENILMLSPLNSKEELEEAVKNNIIVTIDSKEIAINLNELAKKGYNIRAHIKIDTGFGRYGFLYNDFENILDTVKSLDKNIMVEGIFSHFSVAYYKNNKHTIEQFDRFNKVLKILEENDINIKIKHICNSPGILNYPEMCLTGARIGSAFVGRVSSENSLQFRKIGKLETKVAEVRTMPDGFNISYLNTYKTKENEKIAILPIGYIDGFNLSARTDMFRKRDRIRKILMELKSLNKKHNLMVNINGKNFDVIGTIRNVSCDGKNR